MSDARASDCISIFREVMASTEMIFDFDILAFNAARGFQSIQKCSE